MRKFCSQVVIENFFEPCILFLLLKKSSYGYELFQDLRNYCKCSVNIGNLYRGLNRLAKTGHILKTRMKSPKGPNKTVYSLSPKGKELLETWILELEKQNKIVQALIKNYRSSV